MTHTPLRPASSAAAEVPAASAEPQRTGRGRRAWIAAGVLAFVALGSSAYAISRTGADSSAGPDAALADSARSGSDGAFAFTVTGTTCGVSSVGPAVLAQRPTAGQFCLVNVSVRNTGAQAQLLDPGAQHAIDDEGREYPVSDRAAVFLNDWNPTLLDEIPPGATVPGVLPFDVPAGARIGAVVLHESVTSTGVRVPLS